MDCIHGKSYQEFNDDYARNVAAEIVRMVAAFCTPLHDAEDSESRSTFCCRRRATSWTRPCTGHVLKTGAMEKHIMVLCRDPCHMIRIACKDPLQTTGRFEAQHERLFGKHGLLKDRRCGGAT